MSTSSCGPHMTMEEVLAENAALRKQLKEAQCNLDIAENRLHNEELLHGVTVTQRNAAEQRLANAEAQEVVAWGIPNSRPTERNPLMQVLLDKTSCQYPELLIPLYLHPAPPATDEHNKLLLDRCAANIRVGNLEGVLRKCRETFFIAGNDAEVARIDAALAASKGEKT